MPIFTDTARHNHTQDDGQGEDNKVFIYFRTRNSVYRFESQPICDHEVGTLRCMSGTLEGESWALDVDEFQRALATATVLDTGLTVNLGFRGSHGVLSTSTITRVVQA